MSDSYCNNPDCDICKAHKAKQIPVNRNWLDIIRDIMAEIPVFRNKQAVDPAIRPQLRSDMFGGMYYDEDDEEETTETLKSYVWEGVIEASYTGMNTIEKVKKFAIDVVSPTQEGAEEVCRNLWKSILKADYPKLIRLEVRQIREFNPNTDKDLMPKLKDSAPIRLGWGSHWGGLP